MEAPDPAAPASDASSLAQAPGHISDVFGAFQQHVSRQPHRTALYLPQGEISYQQLFDSVQLLRKQLRKHGVIRQPVGIWTEDPLTAYAGILAVLAEGGFYVPLNHKFPPDRNAAVVRASGLRLVITDASSASLQSLQQQVDIQSIGLKGVSGDNEQVPEHIPAQDSDIAYLLFTSGSTGVPKGVPVTHGALRHFLSTVTHPAEWQVGPSDIFLQQFELTFDLSVYSFLTPMVLGAACAPVPSSGVGYLQLLDTLERYAVTVALMVPSALAYLRPYFDEIELPQLRYSLFCGEALPLELATAWAARVPQAQVENVYGPTEATIFCTRYVLPQGRPIHAEHGVVPIGRPMRGVPVLLLDGDSPAAEGELALGGPQVTPGYWHNPEKNAEAFVTVAYQRYYRTGDRCRYNTDGDLLYLGRTDQQVKVDGYRVELGEVEHHARRLAPVQLAVVAVEHQGHTQLVLCLEAWPGDPAELLSALGASLPSYMVPARILNLPQLPLNSNGKIDRPLLRQRALTS